MARKASSKPDSISSIAATIGFETDSLSFTIHHSSFIISPRPYQVDAVQHMVKCIDDDDGNGFVWHTTGSGKTLTSFKASTFATLCDTLLPKLLSVELSVTNFSSTQDLTVSTPHL